MSIESEKSLESGLRAKIPGLCDGCPKLDGFVEQAASLDRRLEWLKTGPAFDLTFGVLSLASMDEGAQQEIEEEAKEAKSLFRTIFGVAAEEVSEAYPDGMSTEFLTAELLNNLGPACIAEFGALSEGFDEAIESCPAANGGDTCGED